MSSNRVANSGRRRASSFGVLRWLSVGAAGVGVGVATWVGAGVAAADTGSSAADAGSASHSSSSLKSGDAKSSAGKGRSAAPRQARRGSAPSPAAARADLEVKDSITATESVAPKPAADSDPSPAAEAVAPLGVQSFDIERTRGAAKSAVQPAAAVANSVISNAQAAEEDVDETPSGQGIPIPSTTIKDLIDGAIYSALDFISNGLARLPENVFSEFLQNAWLTFRRTFFNQAPTLDPEQTSGELGGTISGTLGADDPEGDLMMFGVLQNPVQGTVILNPDGTYIYTPGEDFDGRDVFIVGARNTTTPAINVLDPFDNGITEALVIVEQGSGPRIYFDFTFQDNLDPVLRVARWNDDAKIGLQWAAINLADSFVPAETLTLTFTANAQYNNNNNLASASSPMTAKTGGFFPTVVQSRIQTGSPSVTKDGKPVADGTVNVNFFKNWGYEGVVGEGQYDYESVMMHELMHAFGFISDVGAPGKNGGENESWYTFDQFITNKAGAKAIDPANYEWRTSFNNNLLGGNDGLYFYGPNESDAFDDDPVPLFTPGEWEPGSSVTHLNDAYFNNNTDPSSPNYIQLMNAKDETGVKAPTSLSAIEIGIMKDLGYTMVTTGSTASALASTA